MAPLVQRYICIEHTRTLAYDRSVSEETTLLCGDLGADDACDWLYYHTRYLAEAERWKHGHFRRVKEQLFMC